MSTALEALLAGRIYESGHALRRTTYRHTHLTDAPLAVVMWRLGGERFRAAAIAWGTVGEPFELAVAGEPRNRDLYFAALTPFAHALCERVRRCAEATVARQRGNRTELLPADAPQIIVANRTTVNALGLLGRYLAYLSDRSGVAPDPTLVEAGKHLRFYSRHARVPGQSLIVPLDRLLAEHWATLLSPLEQANLAALDAQIEPPAGTHGFVASAAAEVALAIGPEPTEDIDRVTSDLLRAFNDARARSTEPAVVAGLIDPLIRHYRGLVAPVWELVTRSVVRERALPAAPSVARRFEADREAFGRHADWVGDGGRYRTTDTPRQAAMTLRRLEEAQSRYEAERAIEDPLCMVPHLLDGDAIQGVVAAVNDDHRVVARVKAVRRALLTLDTDDPVTLPVGKRLWWTATAHDVPWEVQSCMRAGAGSRAVLLLTSKPNPDRLPHVATRVTFSKLRTRADGFPLPLSQTPPWTHQPVVPPPAPDAVDAGDSQSETPPVDAAELPDAGRYA